MRLAYYAGFSTAAAAACLLKAFHQRPNFYSATVYLSQSNACLLILTNLCLVLACSFIYGLQRLLYGPLRPVEIEQLSEKAWYAVLDTLLAMPSFREDVGGWLLTMFVLLLAGKVWGWIGEGRVDVLEQQPPANPRLFHARLATSLIFSVLFDLWMLDYCVETVLADPRPGMMVIFTFEFAILSIFSGFTLCRYGLSLIQAEIEKKQMKEAIETRKGEIRAERAAAQRTSEAAQDGQARPPPPTDEPIEVDENEVDVPGWEEKRRYLFALEVFTDFVKLVIYVVFFTVSVTFNGLPMHIMRDVYMTFASFTKRVSDYVAYRKATSDMNTRYPDATTEEIRGDACIVCRESMVAWEQPNAQEQAHPAHDQPAAAPAPAARRDEGLRAKKLPCNHILHLRCLKAWLERQQVCPTCRRPVITSQDAAPAGQPGAPGAPAGPNQRGQRGQQQGQRRNRARIFNLGPIRVGFLGGLDDQVQDLVDQVRNPPAEGQNPALPANRGPNHLGLRIPYLNGPAGGGIQQGLPSTTTGARAAVPTQIQLMQIEQRLLHEAHNLGVEQQQLMTLRMMEAELARLRATHVPAQPPVGTAVAAQRQVVPLPVVVPNAQQPAFVPQPAETLYGNAGQQLTVGQEGMPEGLTLPEGWTLMPLQRADGVVPAAGARLPNTLVPQASASQSQPPIQTTTNEVARDTPASGNVDNPPAELSRTQDIGAGPTDQNGSPLFVPTTAASANGNMEAAPSASASTDASTPAVPQPAPEPTTNSNGTSPQQSERGAPWTSDNWNFGDHDNSGRSAAAANGNGGPSSAANGAPPEQVSDNSRSVAKPAEVEDAPDDDP